MENAKKATLAILAMALLVPLAGCSDGPEKAEPVAEQAPVETGSEIDQVAENAMEAAEQAADDQATGDASAADTKKQAAQ